MIYMKERIKQVDSNIINLFESYGFKKLQRNISNEYFISIFIKHQLFIILKGSNNIYDYPGYINIIVGKGDYTYPALDKTGYPLWKIACYVDHNMNHSEYPFCILYNDNFVDTLKHDIEKYLKPFINDGDMFWIDND